MFNSIRAKVTATALAVIVVATAINAGVGGAMFTDAYASALQSRAVAIGQSLGVQLQRMLASEQAACHARQVDRNAQLLDRGCDLHRLRGLHIASLPDNAFDYYVVDRFDGRRGALRIYLRPKVPFGAES